MKFVGTFKNVHNTKTYWVRIGNEDEYEKQIFNLDDSEKIFFSTDPVVLSVDYKDTFENVFSRSCTINLVADYDILPYFTAKNYNDIPVEIRYVDEVGNIGDVIFSGWLEPMTFNQSYANLSEEFQLNCIDKLGVLEYIYLYDVLKNNQNVEENFVSNYQTPKSIMDIILHYIGFENITYSINNDKTQDTYINPAVFFGKSEDDWMNCKEILEEIGKIYGCWFFQDGDTCVVKNMLNFNKPRPYRPNKNDFCGDDTNISIEPAYNQIKLTCDIETPDDEIINPFDDDYFQPKYSELQKYMSEVICPGNGSNAHQSFKNFVKGNRGIFGNYDKGIIYDHYCQIYENPLWNFSYNDGSYYLSASSQYGSLKYLYEHPGKGGFVAFGKTKNLIDFKNTEKPHSVDLTKYLVINVGGQERNQNSSMETQCENNSPVVHFEYENTRNFIPNDKSTTNFLVISGKILLQPIVPKTGKYPMYSWKKNENFYTKSCNTVADCLAGWDRQRTDNEQYDYSTMWKRVIPHQDNDDGAYYQQVFTGGNTDIVLTGPIENDKLKKWKYQYSTYGRVHDRIDKVSILACRMRIGDKWLVDRMNISSTPATPSGRGGATSRSRANNPTDYMWVKEEDIAVQDGKRLNFFTIGFNPKIEDYILGQSFDICDTRKIEDNIETKGTCIPIMYDDNLSGEMIFEILGPVNATWVETKEVKHGWWIFSHKSMKSEEHSILENIQSIFISDFKISLVSNNAKLLKGKTDNDLVYCSRNNDTYKDIKEYDVKFCSSLTTEQANNLGIDYNLTNSNIMEKDSNDELHPFYGFDYVENSYTYSYTKLEEARVYEQYNLWYKPRRIVETTMELKQPELSSYECNYRFSNNWKFHIQEGSNTYYHCFGRELDLKNDTMKLTLKNIN